MVRWYFVTWSTYGFWLPNDERGSGSVYIGSKALLPYGLATKVNTRQSVAQRPHDPVVRRLAKESLKYEPVVLTDAQIESVGRGFETVIARVGVPVHACAILPDHTHIVTDRPRYAIEKLVALLKAGATAQLKSAGLHPFQDSGLPNGRLPNMWGRGEWTIFIDHDDDAKLLEKIDYTERNPLRSGRPRQRWSFVTPYEAGR
jgi:REP element-mobilizing transposase RayT